MNILLLVTIVYRIYTLFRELFGYGNGCGVWIIRVKVLHKKYNTICFPITSMVLLLHITLVLSTCLL